MPRKKRVKVFVSYARANKSLASRFMEKYSQQVGASKFYNYFLWQDWDIIVGEEWREELEDVLETSNLGLLLVSPAFLASRFIAEVELPPLIRSKTKAVIPVMLQPINFERQDLRGLERHQIFRLANDRFRAPKAYGECKGDQRERFVEELFRQVEERLDKLFEGNLSLDGSPVLNRRIADPQGGSPSARTKRDESQATPLPAMPVDTTIRAEIHRIRDRYRELIQPAVVRTGGALENATFGEFAGLLSDAELVSQELHDTLLMIYDACNVITNIAEVKAELEVDDAARRRAAKARSEEWQRCTDGMEAVDREFKRLLRLRL